MERFVTTRRHLYLTVLLSVFVSVCSKDVARCPPIVREMGHFVETFGEMCYVFVNREKYWTDARSYCWAQGGDMLEVDNEATMIFLRGVLDSSALGWNRNGVWLGAHDRHEEGHWTWASGRPLKYSYWINGRAPGTLLSSGVSLEDCACMRKKDNWKWHDYSCELLLYKYNFICQFPFSKGSGGSDYHTGARDTGDGEKVGPMVAYILGSISILLILLALLFFIFRRRQRQKQSPEDEQPQFENLSYAQLCQNEANENTDAMNCFTANQMNSLYEEVNKPVDHGVNYYANMKGAACDSSQPLPKVTNVLAVKENNATSNKVVEKPPVMKIVNNQLYDLDNSLEGASAAIDTPLCDKDTEDNHIYEDMQ